MKLEINHRKRNDKKLTTWRLKDMLLKNQRVNEEIKEEIKKHLETNPSKSMGCHKSSAQREVHSSSSKKKKNLKSTT